VKRYVAGKNPFLKPGNPAAVSEGEESVSRVVSFRALRPAKPFAAKVGDLPYDVMNVAEARQRVSENPLSFLRVEKSEIDLSDASGVEDLRIYQRAQENLEEMIRQGHMIQEE
jgi:uncharacterized protein (DUF1015 family)